MASNAYRGDSARARRGPARVIGVAALLVALLIATSPARGLEFFDRRLQIHGFYEMQVRSIMRDFSISDGWDLTQWYHVLNLEIEAELAPDGFGPFDLVSAFARVEVRYDCVWTTGCTIFHSANTYGNRSKKVPLRLSDARRPGFEGTMFNGDTRRYHGIPYAAASSAPAPANPTASAEGRRLDQYVGSSQQPGDIWQSSAFGRLFALNSWGVDKQPYTSDDGGLFYLQDYTGTTPAFALGVALNPVDSNDCRTWNSRAVLGREDFSGAETLPHSPQCNPIALGANRNRPNPYNPQDFSPLLPGGGFGSGALPYRPAPDIPASRWGAPSARAQGIYYPDERLQELIRGRDLDSDDGQRYREDRLAWNRGQSQKQERELKELYLDLEMFDSRLWLRVGRQTIVWGKTELFRNQDQFNPVDAALASLPSLEESRIALWSIRGIWSLYDVGPLQDVRFEVAANYDRFRPTDVGVCGEPYTVLLVCGLKAGLIAGGTTGVAFNGTERVAPAWDGWTGIEVGARLEFRWDRFSFAITDFYGRNDLFYVEKVFDYARNVDPFTGRPREGMRKGSCSDGRGANCLTADEALTKHHANQQLFALICGTTIGVLDFDPTACQATVFSTPASTDDGSGELAFPRVVVAINSVLLGDASTGYPASSILGGNGGFTDATYAEISRFNVVGTDRVTVQLNIDPGDGGPDYPADHPLVQADDFETSVLFFYENVDGGSLSARLTDEQEALLGCGRFWNTSCDLDGIDLLNMDASMAYQAWANIEGTGVGSKPWDTTDAGRIQPATVGFQGGGVCTVYENGRTFTLPGCRGPGDEGYDPAVDGTTTGLLQPFTGQQFKNELAAFSWNFQMLLVTNSLPPEGQAPTRLQFDVENPFRTDGCSFRHPSICDNVGAILGFAGVTRNDIRAGGNPRFGRRVFQWHSGSSTILAFEKSNIFGFSMDFAEDRTKSNWSFEFTWSDGVNQIDNNSFSNLSQADLFRLTISMDRPTFVNFLNANRTFLINAQLFVEYIQGYNGGFTIDGPWNTFGVLTMTTGYFQDRLLPALTMVYFVNSNSLAVLPQVTYRYTESFSITFGVAAFAGRTERRVMPILGPGPVGNGVGGGAYNAFVDNGLSAIRERDEVFLRIKWTF